MVRTTLSREAKAAASAAPTHRSMKFLSFLVLWATIINVWVQLVTNLNSTLQQEVATEKAKLYPFRYSHSQNSNDKNKSNDINDRQVNGHADKEVEEKLDPCKVHYHKVATATRTKGLTSQDMKRARAFRGNEWGLFNLARKLNNIHMKRNSNPQPITAVVTGGSISLGHGVVSGLRYSDRLEAWLNEHYVLPEHMNQKHVVLNKGSHGADSCAMAKRLNLLIQSLPANPDLFVLEFAVNDYQGQDHVTQIDFKMSTFFEGFQDLAMCTESVVAKLISTYPNAAIVFLEMRTAILARKTASLLHMGVAQHYHIPVLSYDQAISPGYDRLLRELKAYNYTKPIGEEVFSYPHGCHACEPNHIVPAFRDNGCASVCDMQRFADEGPLKCDEVQSGREPCYVPFFAHDEVHPSGVGHQIASDIIVEAISSVTHEVCQQGQQQFTPLPMPSQGWLLSGSPSEAQKRYDFIMVNDTYDFFTQRNMLEASSHTPGFTLYDDKFGRHGWIATNPDGGESVQFDINLPQSQDSCYIPVLSVVKSYANMGTFTVTVKDQSTQQVLSSQDFDALWSPRISIPQDLQLLQDDNSDATSRCTGSCAVIVTTHPKHADRADNKVKIVTLAVRKCVT